MSSTREVGGHEYEIGALDVFAQFHVHRRIMPILNTMTASLGAAFKAGKDKGDDLMEAMLAPAMEVVSRMSDADVDFVLKTCLGAVKRNDGGRLAQVLVQGRLMYADVTMQQMVQLAIAVIRENMGDFSLGPLAGLLE